MTFLLAEQNTNMALRYADYGYILENGRVVMDGQAGPARERGREGVLPRHGRGRPQEFPRRQELQAAQAVVGLSALAIDVDGQSDDFARTPPFDAEQSLLELQRAMRDCKL